MLRKVLASAAVAAAALGSGPLAFADDPTQTPSAGDTATVTPTETAPATDDGVKDTETDAPKSEQEQVQESLEDVQAPDGMKMLLVDEQNSGIFLIEGGAAWNVFAANAGGEMYSPDFVDALNAGDVQVDAQFAEKTAEEIILDLGLQGEHRVSLGEGGAELTVFFPVVDNKPAASSELPETPSGTINRLEIAGITAGIVASLGLLSFILVKLNKKKK